MSYFQRKGIMGALGDAAAVAGALGYKPKSSRPVNQAAPATAGSVPVAATPASSSIAPPPGAPVVASSGPGIGTVLVIGAVGVGGFLIYRHFKKKAGSAPDAP